MKKWDIIFIKLFFIMTIAFFWLGFNPPILMASDIMTSTDPYTGQTLKIRVNGTNASVVYYSGSQWDYTLPATVRGFNNTTLTINAIEDNAFKDCTSLRHLTLPGTLTSIGAGAFTGCNNLITINIPDHVTFIGERAFSSCRSLESITIPSGITQLNNFLFSNCQSMQTINLPAGISKTGQGAFTDCAALTSISIPDSVSQIGSGAFMGCSSLRTIAIPNGVTVINEFTFKNCTNLTDLQLPEGITRIDQLAFENCSSLTGINLPDSLRSTGMGVFSNCTSLKSITIPGNLKRLETLLFDNCYSLTNVSIPMSVTQFGGSVFKDCISLKSIVIPDSVTMTDSSTFSGCTGLERVKFSAGNAIIHSYDFYNCSSLKLIIIPEHIVYLGDHAFDGCTSLSEARFLGNAPYVNDFGVHVFDNCAADFKIKYIFGKTGWSNPFHGYPAESEIQLNADIPELQPPVEINPNVLENIPNNANTTILTLKAWPGVGFVRLDWNSITDSRGVKGYNIYKASSSGNQPNNPEASSSNLFYIDPNVQIGTTYYYIVKPVFNDNSVGTASNEISASPQNAAGTIQLTVNNPVMNGNGIQKQIDEGFNTAPVIKDGRTYLPIRGLLTEMGGNIEWNANQQKVTTLFGGKTVEVWIGSNNIRINGINKTMDAIPYISGTGRTMLPLRFVGESLGCNVVWDDATKTATITYDSAALPEPPAEDIKTPAAPLPTGVPSSLPAPSIANLQLVKDDSGVPYFRMEVTIPDSVLTLDQQRPADGWVNLNCDGKIDNGEWGATGGGGGHLEVFCDAEMAVPGKKNAYYVTCELEDEGDLTETVIESRTYSYRFSLSYIYYNESGEEEEVISPWSNELSGQSESYYRSDEE